MTADAKNREWELEDFVNALTRDLDKVQDTLAVKGASTPLTYMVKDLSLDLQVAQRFDGKRIMFRPPMPGEKNVSKITLQLGSISDRQIRETTRKPPAPEDVAIADLDGLDDATKVQLDSIGVKSSRDLEKVRRKNIDLRQASGNRIDYNALAKLINKKRRARLAPQVRTARVARNGKSVALTLEGNNLLVSPSAGFPVATVDGRLVKVRSASDTRVVMDVDEGQLSGSHQLDLALDPYAILTLRIRS